MEAYFDNSATTRCYDEVREIMDLTMLRDYGNPSSMHRKGVESEKYIREAARTLAGILKADAREIYFTSGGTESDNWALFGTAMARGRKGKHIIIIRNAVIPLHCARYIGHFNLRQHSNLPNNI